MSPASDLSRRDFLNATATIGGGLIVALTLPGATGASNSAVAAAAKPGAPAKGTNSEAKPTRGPKVKPIPKAMPIRAMP